ncbi:conserved exported hypothetical protein [Flavobacterium sp. 9R]|uniref:hypothetical protein n=1 Tax=Flavobacterium sp. 9R TaxID=2653143 RepID=UPI0012F1A974|nr:hypothetical protein [Flavobacterium sp. 9R]VXB28271.1 conserved exported hypothetical protein [Flavobacterium sp. 9R]
MHKKLLSLLLFSILSTLAYSQKKGKMALPIIEEEIATSLWENKKSKSYSWLVIYDQKKLDSILAIKRVVTINEKPKQKQQVLKWNHKKY